MSAQAGVFYMDRRPIGLGVVSDIDTALRDLGPDGSGSRLEPGLLMVSRALHVTPEDEREEQPLVSPAGRVLTWDGRLDNRDDLLLQLRGEVGLDATDGTVALATFERWGIDGLARLVGDWSLVLWDAPERRLLLASDYMGVRPLYYRHAPDHVAWSSSLGELVLREGARDDLDEVFVLGYLVGCVTPDRTPYVPVRSITPAHALIFSAAGDARHCFYDYPANTIRYRDEWSYEEHLREVFVKAVSARLRSTRPVWAELSGGLDSSSVVCMADWLIERSSQSPDALRTVSLFSDASPEVDERHFVRAVEQTRGCSTHAINIDGVTDLADRTGAWITPSHPREARLAELQYVAEHGGRVLLTGQGGDLVMANDSDWSQSLIELLTELNVRQLLREGYAWALATKRPLLEILLKQAVYVPPSALRARLRTRQDFRERVRHAMWRVGKKHQGSTWGPELWRALHLGVQDTAKRVEAYPGRAARRLVAGLEGFAQSRIMQTPSDVAGPLATHPFLDRRTVELVLSFPQRILNRPYCTRALMRRAFHEILPSLVYHRFSKGYASPFLIRILRRQLALLQRDRGDFEITGRRWLSSEQLQILVVSLKSGYVVDPSLARAVISTECWLRARSAETDDVLVRESHEKGGEHHAVREA